MNRLYQNLIQTRGLFLVADTRLYTLPCWLVGRLVGWFVGWSITFLNSEWFLHYCSCPTLRDWITVYPALFLSTHLDFQVFETVVGHCHPFSLNHRKDNSLMNSSKPFSVWLIFWYYLFSHLLHKSSPHCVCWSVSFWLIGSLVLFSLFLLFPPQLTIWPSVLSLTFLLFHFFFHQRKQSVTQKAC